MRERLRRTYLNLGTGELTATAVFVIGAVFAVQPKLVGTEQIAFWAALGPLVLILLQAGCYWLLARGWLLERPAPQPVVSLYRVLRILDPIALLAGLILIVAFWPARIGVAILVVAIWLFGRVRQLLRGEAVVPVGALVHRGRGVAHAAARARPVRGAGQPIVF